MDATLDRFGRIVIPKKIRDEFNLRPGSQFLIKDSKDGIILKIVEDEPSLKEKDGILIFSGKAIGNIESALDNMRNERIHSVKDKF